MIDRFTETLIRGRRTAPQGAARAGRNAKGGPRRLAWPALPSHLFPRAPLKAL